VINHAATLVTQGLDAFFYLFLTYRHDNPFKLQHILILTAKTLDNATNGGFANISTASQNYRRNITMLGHRT